jgi:putative transposase
VGPNPTDRAKPGVKQSLLVEADGGPLGVVIAGANVPDAQLLEATIDAIVLERPAPEPDFEQHLCLDKGYDNPTGWGACIDRDYVPHISPIRDERPPRPKRYKARRWVVEMTQPHYPRDAFRPRVRVASALPPLGA